MLKTERCPGSGVIVDGPDENDGTVMCFECGRSLLRTDKKVIGGVERLVVSEHNRPVRRSKGKAGVKDRRRLSIRRSSQR
jgi:hypothetical protein